MVCEGGEGGPVREDGVAVKVWVVCDGEGGK